MSTKKDQLYGPLYGFALNKPRQHPPIECDPREWARRTQSRVYIPRIAKSVRMVNGYLLTVRGHGRGVSGHQKDALHYFADVATFDSERRARGNRPSSEPSKDTPILDSLKY